VATRMTMVMGIRRRPRQLLTSLVSILTCFTLWKCSNAFHFRQHPVAGCSIALVRKATIAVRQGQTDAPHSIGGSKVLRRTSVLSGMWSQDDEIRGPDRIKACVPYMLPLIDGDHFGRFIYARIPPLGALDEITIGPLAELAHNVPFLTVALFIALTLGTRFNSDMSRNLRFSAQQAALIDVALLFPELISSGFQEDPLPRYITEPCSNFVWYAYMSVIVYCFYSNLRGKRPDQIPFISNVANVMVGPF
jgi:Chloroplast import apparatus Tic20-like